MDMDDFQRYALKSVALSKGDVSSLSHRSLGVSGEAGILANLVKRIIRDKQGKADEQDIAAVKERLGDIMYYTAVLAEYFDLKLSDIAEANMRKSDAFRSSREQ